MTFILSSGVSSLVTVSSVLYLICARVELGEKVTAVYVHPVLHYYSSSGSQKHCLTPDHPFRDNERQTRREGGKEVL